MRTLRISSIMSLFLAIATLSLSTDSWAQQKKETFKVNGECGMCKSKIEKAAKAAGASYALWDVDTKVLTVKYKSSSTNKAKIQQQIAAVGYDTPDFKATDEAYNKLHECCKYDRTLSLKDSSCCTEECKAKCQEKGCCKDGAACKENCCSGENAAACCKDGEGCTADCCKKSQ